jgi:hypothetical protein
MTLTANLVAIVLVSVCFTAASHAAEKRISQSDLPAAVQKAAQKQSKGATVRGYTQDNENGQLEYEMEMTVNGHSKNVSFGPDGRLLEVEEQVKMSALPATVQSGLKVKAGNGKITKIESITKHGTIVAYEAQVRTMDRHSEIQVGPNGKPLNHEE